MKYLLFLPLLALTGCTDKFEELNYNVNMTTELVLQNAATVDQSTQEIRHNTQMIEESTRVMRENHESLEKMKNS